jgi:hypothetical protein
MMATTKGADMRSELASMRSELGSKPAELVSMRSELVSMRPELVSMRPELVEGRASTGSALMSERASAGAVLSLSKGAALMFGVGLADEELLIS